MMLKWIETTGRSEEDAISAALFQLGLDRDDVSIEVIERAKSGFLGFGGNPAKVRVSYEEENGVPCKKDLMKDPAPAPVEETVLSAQPLEQPAKEDAKEEGGAAAAPEAVEEETILAAKPGMSAPAKRRRERPQRDSRERRREEKPQKGDEVLIGAADQTQPETLSPVAADDAKAQQIAQFLTGLMAHLKVEATPELFISQEGSYKVILQGSDLGAIIGRRGETLDAIQQLTSYSVNRGQSKRVRIHVDAEGYRAKREESLQRLAVKVAGKVVKYRKSMALEPMNAYERHVIHTALQDYPNVSTYSTGVEPNRRTVISYEPGQK